MQKNCKTLIINLDDNSKVFNSLLVEGFCFSQALKDSMLLKKAHVFISGSENLMSAISYEDIKKHIAEWDKESKEREELHKRFYEQNKKDGYC